MNTQHRLLLLAASLLLSLGSYAEDSPTSGMVGDEDATERVTAAMQIESIPFTKLIGQEVHGADDAPFAEIKDLLIDLDNGRVVHVILSGEKIAGGEGEIPPHAFGYTWQDRTIKWRGDASKLGTAPKFSPPGTNRQQQRDRAAEIYRHYGQEPYFIVSEEEAGPPPTPGGVHAHGKKDSSVEPVRLGRVILATDLLKLTVRDSMDAKVGGVEDLIVDLPGGRVVVLIIGSGGFLGIGDSKSAVPPSAIGFLGDEKEELLLTASKDTLKNAPRYREEDAERFNDRAYTDEIYRSYNTAPYAKGTAADNTRLNKRDRGRASLTPINQGNSREDIAITASIRKAIRAREGFSMSARNVKIITRDGRVTLRGPVRTDDEKTAIAEIAARTAGSPERVTNQLEVITSSAPQSEQ